MLHLVDFASGEERVVFDPFLLTLSIHHVVGISQHTRGELFGRLAEEKQGLRVLSHKNGKAADVVEVTMGKDDEIDRRFVAGSIIRHRFDPCHFGVEAGIDRNAVISKLDQHAA